MATKNPAPDVRSCVRKDAAGEGEYIIVAVVNVNDFIGAWGFQPHHDNHVSLPVPRPGETGGNAPSFRFYVVRNLIEAQVRNLLISKNFGYALSRRLRNFFHVHA